MVLFRSQELSLPLVTGTEKAMLLWGALEATSAREHQPGRNIPSCLSSYLSRSDTRDQAPVLPHLLAGVSGSGADRACWGGGAVEEKLALCCWAPLLLVLCKDRGTCPSWPWCCCVLCTPGSLLTEQNLPRVPLPCQFWLDQCRAAQGGA